MKYFQEIENYIWGRLSAEEKQVFEQQMEKDEALAREVAVQRQERELITQIEEGFWLEEMKAWRAEMTADEQQNAGPEKAANLSGEYEERKEAKPISSGGRNYRRILQWSAAAAAAALITAYLLLPSGDSFSIAEERVIPAYLSNEKSSAGTNDDIDSLDALFLEAYEALGAQQYQIADERFQTIENAPEANEWLLQATDFNRALLLLEQNRKEEALIRLKRISEDRLHRYHDKADALYKRLAD